MMMTPVRAMVGMGGGAGDERVVAPVGPLGPWVLCA